MVATILRPSIFLVYLMMAKIRRNT